MVGTELLILLTVKKCRLSSLQFLSSMWERAWITAPEFQPAISPGILTLQHLPTLTPQTDRQGVSSLTGKAAASRVTLLLLASTSPTCERLTVLQICYLTESSSLWCFPGRKETNSQWSVLTDGTKLVITSSLSIFLTWKLENKHLYMRWIKLFHKLILQGFCET